MLDDIKKTFGAAADKLQDNMDEHELLVLGLSEGKAIAPALARPR